MKLNQSEIGLEFERKKCFVVSILFILLRLKLINIKLVVMFGTFSIFFSIDRRGLLVLSMNAKVIFIDKLFGNFLQSEEVGF